MEAGKYRHSGTCHADVQLAKREPEWRYRWLRVLKRSSSTFVSTPSVLSSNYPATIAVFQS
jgi:hypothetical protein